MALPASKPISGNNAIEKLVCGIVFAHPLPEEALTHMRTALDELKGELPGHSEERQMAALPPGVPVEITQLIGRGSVRHARFFTGPDGVVKWRLVVSQELISLECGEFTGKSEFFEKLKKFINPILLALTQNNLNVALREIGLHVIDKFSYGANFEKENYSAKEIFNDNSGYLTKNAFATELFWHVFQGWFENCADSEHKLLQQLNIQNTEINPITKDIATIIEHQLMHQIRNNSITISDLLDDGDFEFVKFFEILYEKNIKIIKELLNEEKLKQIGFEA